MIVIFIILGFFMLIGLTGTMKKAGVSFGQLFFGIVGLFAIIGFLFK